MPPPSSQPTRSASCEHEPRPQNLCSYHTIRAWHREPGTARHPQTRVKQPRGAAAEEEAGSGASGPLASRQQSRAARQRADGPSSADGPRDLPRWDGRMSVLLARTDSRCNVGWPARSLDCGVRGFLL